jgi:SAM-dependent methyltransferase
MPNETAKCYQKRLHNGDFDRYLKGHGIDIGCGPDPLKIPEGSVATWEKHQGDGQLLAGVANAMYDFVYSSHCLEHLRSVEISLENWVRVLKPGGYLYVVVPDFLLYEKLKWPPMFNQDHKHTFSIDLLRSKVGRDNHYHIGNNIEPLLQSLGVVLEKSFLEDDLFDYNLGPVDQTLGSALSQLCFVGQKK